MADLQFSADDLNVMLAQIVQDLKKTMLHSQLKQAAQVIAAMPDIDISNLEVTVPARLAETGWEQKLQNAVYRHLRHCRPLPHPDTPQEQMKEPLTYIRRAQSTWEKRIVKSLNSMCTELSVPLARKRPLSEQNDMKSRWNELGTDEPDLSTFRPVYGPRDFLDMLTTIRHPNLATAGHAASAQWGLINLPLKVKTMQQLREDYKDLSPGERQTGVDDTADGVGELFDMDRVKLGRRVIQANHAAVAQQYARCGCSGGLRGQIWKQILAVTVDDMDKLLYDQLRHYVLQHDLLIDNLYYKDVKLTATNDDQYFVFEDFLYQVLLIFSRDTSVLKHFGRSSATPAKSYIRGMLGVDEFAVVYPPNGVIPFHGFAMLVAPLCFVYGQPTELYFVFREMYMRHLFRLHTISSHPQGILSLCILFESLLQTLQPHLFFHLRQINAHPLKIAFKWMMRAYSGYLASDQLLLLWDRILGYDSIELLAVLAVAIFAFRRTNLLEANTQPSVEAILTDLTTLQVTPLLQIVLFPQSGS
ncbi:TBC1 domain family member 19-like [Diadema antillarum]|uniref:TBC1 domain family member 19-like n=1 Tax=Diadema antillarum TaxID=105358 RepID=UPI003A879D75